MALSTTGCTLSPDANHEGEEAPREAPLARPVRTAWVLSSGGPRGFVHVGVLRALEELGCVPDLIVGSSVGAIVGALRAASRSAAELQALALDLNPLAVARWAVGAKERLSGAPVAELVRNESRQERLERFPIPMACVATRQSDSATVAFTAGDVGLAVQACAAIEGQFAPVRIRGQTYVDSDHHMPMPVRVARALGAQRVLAIDASAHLDKAPAGTERYRQGDLRKEALTKVDAVLADLVLKPDFGYYVSLSREFRERAINAGYRDTMAQAVALRQLHAA